jgi:hypothetical protein
MRPVKEACDELVARLKSAGYTGSSLDPETVDPPAAVWVQPRSIGGLTLAGGATLTCWLYLLAGNHETGHAMTLLDDGLAGLLDLLDGHGIGLADTDDEAVDLTAAVLLPGTSTPMPAYRLAITLDL